MPTNYERAFVAVMALAERVVDDATSICDSDLQRLETSASPIRRSWM